MTLWYNRIKIKSILYHRDDIDTFVINKRMT